MSHNRRVTAFGPVMPEMGGEEKEMNRYGRYIGNELVNVARLRLLGIGKYAFETSLFGEKPYELNMNMPLFDSEAQAITWISNSGKWQIIAE